MYDRVCSRSATVLASYPERRTQESLTHFILRIVSIKLGQYKDDLKQELNA